VTYEKHRDIGDFPLGEPVSGGPEELHTINYWRPQRLVNGAHVRQSEVAVRDQFAVVVVVPEQVEQPLRNAANKVSHSNCIQQTAPLFKVQP
jgi:hypothetical protein